MPYHAKAALVGWSNAARDTTRAIERTGCVVPVCDRQTSPLLRREIGRHDIVVNAGLWDAFRSGHLVYREDLRTMKPGSLIIDIRCDEAMGVEPCRPTTIAEPTHVVDGALHYAVDHTGALYYQSPRQSIGRVVAQHAAGPVEGRTDEVLPPATIVSDGRIVDERITRFQHRERP